MRLPILRLRPLPALLICLTLAGCASTTGPTSALGYYWQSVRGHMQLMHAAEPIDRWIARPDISPALRERLQLAQRARAFAVAELGLPDNASYRRYADLKRPAAVWNVVAAPPSALTLHTWCFPVTGCIGYRGYFTEADAKAADVIAFDRIVTTEDRDILESTDPDVPLDQAGIEFNMPSDRPGVLLRRMLLGALAQHQDAA